MSTELLKPIAEITKNAKYYKEVYYCLLIFSGLLGFFNIALCIPLLLCV
jgi:hypothetical protein